MTAPVQVAVPSGDMLGECATWSVREQALYWVDVRATSLHRFDPLNGARGTWRLPELCGGIALATDGIMLALRSELARFDPASGNLTRWCQIEPDSAGNRLNEMRCDAAGRLWVGSMRDFGVATSGSLYCVSATGQVAAVLGGVTIPNSLGFSPDGRIMYFADTAEGAIRAYASHPDSPELVGKQVLLSIEALPGRPDGCAVDREGHVWTTRVGAGLVARVSPDGSVVQHVPLPTSQPTSCALGGRDLRTLFITTARQKLDAATLRAEPEAGHLLAVRVEVPGTPEPEFAAGLTVHGRAAA